MIATIASLLTGADFPVDGNDPVCPDPPAATVEIDVTGSIETDPSSPRPPSADAPEPDELGEIEQFLAEVRAATEPDSVLEDDLKEWK